jgi:hypothetical protein
MKGENPLLLDGLDKAQQKVSPNRETFKTTKELFPTFSERFGFFPSKTEKLDLPNSI